MAQIWDAVVIGAGPAGLMAATELTRAGHRVLLAEAKPSVARKFLMAGKSGLNLTKDESFDRLVAHYGAATLWLEPMIRAFDAQKVQEWARELGVELFTGSTGRVFPKVMKASPLVRAWLAELDQAGVTRALRWRWLGWDQDGLRFDTPEGPQVIRAKATVLALGGASWARLGSDGAWAPVLAEQQIALTPFASANVGLSINWSAHMANLMGEPVKGIRLTSGALTSTGEAVISATGLEGGGIYAISAAVRDGAALRMDLKPDLTEEDICKRLSRPRGKTSSANHLRKSLKLGAVRTALLQEFAHPLPKEPAALAHLIKNLPVAHQGPRPIDQAISTAGGVPKAALDSDLMLKARPGTFCAGEMLDWEAPTGGYLITACLATGRWAGKSAVRYLASAKTR